MTRRQSKSSSRQVAASLRAALRRYYQADAAACKAESLAQAARSEANLVLGETLSLVCPAAARELDGK